MLLCLQFRIENSLTSVMFYVFFRCCVIIFEKKKKKKHRREPLFYVLLFVNEKTYLSVTIK